MCAYVHACVCVCTCICVLLGAVSLSRSVSVKPLLSTVCVLCVRAPPGVVWAG